MGRPCLKFLFFGTRLPMLTIDRLLQSPRMPFGRLGEIELAFANVAYLLQIHRNVRTAIRDGSHPTGSVRFIAYVGSLIGMCTGIFLHCEGSARLSGIRGL